VFIGTKKKPKRMLKNSFLWVYFTSKGLNDLKNNILVAIELG